jgi:DNA polymerase III alpha subunit
MKWNKQFQEKASTQTQRQKAQNDPTEVNGISDIPFEATQEERFRLTVDVAQVIERETKTGSPCYFVNCRDSEGMSFAIVVWDSQWARLQGQVKEGAALALNVRVPKEGFSAFMLA